MSDLERWRQRLSRIDNELLALVAERHKLTSRIGTLKRDQGIATRDFAREKEVIELAREQAERLGLAPDLAETLMRTLIQSSLTQQERDRIGAEGRGGGQRALVIGGAGKMGRWFVSYLASQGYDVEVADPAGEVGGIVCHRDWTTLALDYALIVVATPLRTGNRVLTELAAKRPDGLVVDVASLKSPVREGLAALAETGCRIASLHPMFGPDTELLSGRHVVLVDVGQPESMEEARALFSSTMAQMVEMSLDEHDKVMAFVLGLSHALNIVFFTALARSGESVPRLSEISSTTFEAQLAVASRVARESPTVYFEIQSLNAFGRLPLEALEQALARFRQAVDGADEEAFNALMEGGAAFLDNQ